MSKKSLLDHITDADPRLIFTLTLIVLAIPLVIPMGLPIEVGTNAQEFFDGINALPEGSIVAFQWQADSMTWMEQGLGATVVLEHVMMKPGLKIVAWSPGPQGPLYWESLLNDFGTFGKEYGTDFVYLGYLPGGESLAAAMADDVWGACGGVDYYGTSLEDLPLMEDVHNANDFSIHIQLPNGENPILISLRQWRERYPDVPFYCIPLGAVQASLVSYKNTGQIDAWIAGAREAAEYELLMGSPGLAIAGMDAQSVGHIYIVVLILIGNFGYLIHKRGGNEK